MSGTPPVAPLGAPVVITDDFLPVDLATRMRADFEAHFAGRDAHDHRHRVWNYWFVPELCTYLRTAPENIIRHDRVDAFVRALQAWSIATIGMGNVTWPSLCLYVSGCRETLHTKAADGRFGFVYSLTRDQRRTVGGETLIFRESDPFLGSFVRFTAGRSFYDVIEPKFNRLVVLDDRLPHAVERVEGSMDPIEGRLVLHGHLNETGTIVTGDLPGEAVEAALLGLFRDFAERNSVRVALYQGPLVLRFVISAQGSVESCDTLVDRVVHEDPRHTEWESLRDELVNRIKLSRFPPARGETAVTKPLIFGAPLPGKI